MSATKPVSDNHLIDMLPVHLPCDPRSPRAEYDSLLKSKAVIAVDHGYDGPVKINNALTGRFGFQGDVARWGITGGNRAYFLSFGMGKTVIQIQTLLSILKAFPGGDALIVCPLGVRGEFVHDALKFFKLKLEYLRTNAEYDAALKDRPSVESKPGRIYLTNYERVRDGDIDPNRFVAVSLDEAAVLRSFGSKTYQTFLTLFDKVRFKFVATATPSPNRFKELIHYAAFLGVMDSGQALTRFFKRDSSQAGNLTIHPHKVREFRLWLATWAVFVQKPSDMCDSRGVPYSDEGYDLPPARITKHRLPADHATAGFDSWGQGKLIRDAATSLQDASKEKRDSIGVRVARMVEIVKGYQQPDGSYPQFIVWCELNDEQDAVERALKGLGITVCTLRGADRDETDYMESELQQWKDGNRTAFVSKLSMYGAGVNFQQCHISINLGLNHKFYQFIQGVMRVQRFGQQHEVDLHLVYTEAEDGIYEDLMEKWEQHKELHCEMAAIIKEYGLSKIKIGAEMQRSIGVTRQEHKGQLFTCVNNDCVDEMDRLAENSVGLAVSSWPFSDHYEYTESYEDFGHNDGDRGFFAQMDHLTPKVIRALQPGRMYCVHAKDRIVYGSVSGDGMYTVNPFSDKCVAHCIKHGLRFCGRITVVTDVVRENGQTYRLGWSENAKDGTKMGVGSSEYVLLFRKLPSDKANSYADVPVVKSKEDYTRARWQFDAHAFWRSRGDRFLTPEEVAGMPMDQVRSFWRSYTDRKVYNFEEHVEVAKAMDNLGILPSSFMALDVVNPGAGNVWDDITRMRTLNTEQGRKGWEQHVCLAVGSLVLTKERGYVSIQDVLVGEHALTHMGRWRAVLAVQNTGIRPAITVRAQGVPGLTLTPDHKLWLRQSKRVREREGAEYAEPEWVEAKDSLVGGYVNFKLPPVDEGTPHSFLDWWIIGRWLADGHWETRGGISISCGRHETDTLIESLQGHAGAVRDTGTSHQITVTNSKTIRDVLRHCGHGASGKHLPPEAFTMPTDAARALLTGYLSGDGHFDPERNRYSASSVSKTLALGIAFLAQRAFGAIASVYAGRPERDSEIEGRSVKCKQDWIISFDVAAGDRYKQPFVLADGAWKKVRGLEGAGEVETWNLRVDEDESFTAEGCIVKNCPLQLDIVERLIERYSNPGDLVLDMFGGLGTVAYCAVLAGRRGYSIELSEGYWKDSISYCRAAEQKVSMPSLFDSLPEELLDSRDH